MPDDPPRRTVYPFYPDKLYMAFVEHIVIRRPKDAHGLDKSEAQAFVGRIRRIAECAIGRLQRVVDGADDVAPIERSGALLDELERVLKPPRSRRHRR